MIYQADSAGNRIPDFSFCGYAASEKPIPQVPVKIGIPPQPGDATGRIQGAIDYVSSLSPDAGGFRGAVLLGKGVHRVEGRLVIRNSGVIIRGSGMDENGTRLIAAGKSRET
ncbi:MAG: hypothetical protein MZV63_58085 [Marinilabiliales bacterium]|nr:hypothetical protein [Marinilabiliales bacterium]